MAGQVSGILAAQPASTRRCGSPRTSFDNRASLDAWNLRRIIGDHAGRSGLIQRVRYQGAVLCDIAEHLGGDATSVLVPAPLVSDVDVLVDRPVPLAGAVSGLAETPAQHRQHLLDLRAEVAVHG